MVTNEIVRVNIEYSAPNTSQAMNVFHFRFNGDAQTDAAAVVVLRAWADDWAEQWQAIASNDWTCERATFEVVNLDGSVNRDLGSYDISLVGLGGSDMEPSATSGFIFAPSATPGRRGAKYVPGIQEDHVEDGLLSAAAIVGLALMLSVWVTPSEFPTGGDEFQPAIVDFVLGVMRVLLNEGTVSSVPAYQRRRKPGVGS